MFRKKIKFVVGLTTFNNEFLEISVSGLARIRDKFTLVVYNDNPDTTVTKKQIRKLGYRGKLYVKNGDKNLGQLGARLALLEFIKAQCVKADWIMFADDDDILLNLKFPRVGDNNFAVIQNMVVLRTRLLDVLRVMKAPNNYQIDKENIALVRPHVGLAGTWVKADILFQLGDMLKSVEDKIQVVSDSLLFRAPIDIMMWSALNIFARAKNPDASPIYMDNINYIAIDLDTAKTKYGRAVQPSKNAVSQIERAIAQYDAIIRAQM